MNRVFNLGLQNTLIGKYVFFSHFDFKDLNLLISYLHFIFKPLLILWECISDRLLNFFMAYKYFGFLVFTVGSSGLGSPLGRSRHSSSQSDLTSSSSSSSGLSFTACMSDFSLYVFHPYGAGKQKTAVSGLTPGSGGLGILSTFASPKFISSFQGLIFSEIMIPLIMDMKQDQKLLNFFLLICILSLHSK